MRFVVEWKQTAEERFDSDVNGRAEEAAGDYPGVTVYGSSGGTSFDPADADLPCDNSLSVDAVDQATVEALAERLASLVGREVRVRDLAAEDAEVRTLRWRLRVAYWRIRARVLYFAYRVVPFWVCRVRGHRLDRVEDPIFGPGLDCSRCHAWDGSEVPVGTLEPDGEE